MPTLTRAALRSKYSDAVIAEDAEIESRRSSSSSPPSTPTTPSPSFREVLGQISTNNVDENIVAMPGLVADVKGAVDQENQGMKNGKGIKESHGGKKNEEKVGDWNEDVPMPDVMILEDEVKSTTSSAVEDACEDLMKESNGGM